LPLLTIGLPALLLAQLPTAFDLETGLAEADEDAPPVFQVEVLIFAYNEFNPLEEEFPLEPPRSTKDFTGATIKSTPHTLQPSSADWMLESLTLPTDPITEPGTGYVNEDLEAAAAPATDLEPAGTTRALDGTLGTDAGVITPSTDEFDEFGNTFGPPPEAEDDGLWYTMLDTEELTLDRAFARLNNLDAYTPLIHTGWSQEALLEEDAQAFDVTVLGTLRPSGTIRLHRSRFLHLTLDLVLQNDYRYTFAPVEFDDPHWPLAEIRAPLRYHIDVQRRIRSDEVHFFDHPAFGVLISVRPQPEDPEGEGELPVEPAA
jgi:hypothetical protein